VEHKTLTYKLKATVSLCNSHRHCHCQCHCHALSPVASIMCGRRVAYLHCTFLKHKCHC